MREQTYKNYLLNALLVILAFNFADRIALGLLLQNIKVDLQLTDSQLGLLTGIAFALFYSVMGIPIARWADRGNRVAIISITTALWSAAVALCGLAGNFFQLLLIRVGVAVGEAGCMPPAHSLIADYFTRSERPRAVARYMLGGPASLLIGYLFAGWLNELYGWRTTFMILGLPGVALALLAWLTLREPRRKVHSIAGTVTAHPTLAAPPEPSLREVWVALWSNRTFRHLLLCFAIVHFFGYGIVQWQPAFFVRSYGLGTGELGTWLAVIYGSGGLLGTYLGGECAARYAARNEPLQLKGMAAIYVLFAFLSACTYFAPNYQLALAFMGLAGVASAMLTGPLWAIIQMLVSPRMRAVAVATIYLFANLIGMGLGPLAVGAMSDGLRAAFGEESLRWALLAMSPGYFWAAWHLSVASRTVLRDLDRENNPDATLAPIDDAQATHRFESSAAPEAARHPH